ncbi:hypothetical protein FIV41_23265 [Pseudomonas marginalis]|uniref:Uncharacterized protein n=1 Tax=Pseudomonas marginalis TaxID=298 RepID=A0A9X9FW11_PSEMA|nr:hypothetical protein FIV41_23265 [Pseudomonas marginalis]
MDGAWRRPPKSLSDSGHTEPRRGAEWWGKSPLLTLGLFQSEPPSGRNPKPPLPQQRICTRSNPKKWSAQRPSSGASPNASQLRRNTVTVVSGLARSIS